MCYLNKVPKNIKEVQELVKLMQQMGFQVTEEDVIKEAIKNGLQSLLDERMSGYYTVHWSFDYMVFDVIGFEEDKIGSVKPDENQLGWIEQFKMDSDMMWLNLDKGVNELIG